MLRECVAPSVKMVLSETELPVGGSTAPPESSLTMLLENISSQVSTTATAMEYGEYDFDGTKKVKVSFLFLEENVHAITITFKGLLLLL